MKLNITKDKLTRMLLSANPVLANCKGSKKAVRIFLNMLGMKNIITSQAIQTTFALTGLKDVQNSQEYLTLLNYEILDIMHLGTHMHDIRGGASYSILGLYDDTLIDTINTQIQYISSTSVSVTFKPSDELEIQSWNMRPGNPHITQKPVSVLNNVMIKGVNEFVKLFNTRNKSLYEKLGDATITANTTLTSQYSADNDEFSVLITNVTDKEMLAAKSILAKQLQEILPINMIVEADNIIGCANE